VTAKERLRWLWREWGPFIFGLIYGAIVAAGVAYAIANRHR